MWCNVNQILKLTEYICDQTFSRLAPLTMRYQLLLKMKCIEVMIKWNALKLWYHSTVHYNIKSACRQTASGLAPLLIGLTVTAAHLVLIPFTGTSINPARFFVKQSLFAIKPIYFPFRQSILQGSLSFSKFEFSIKPDLRDLSFS